MERVVLWEMAGRRPNMELQLPFIHRILAEHPNVEFHVWNMARNPDDNDYVRSITGERTTVLNELYPYGFEKNMLACFEIWRHYTQAQYQGCLFVKLDDDVVFLQSGRFGDFLASIHTHRGSIVSANVINNEGCIRLEPDLWETFNALGIPLQKVHDNGRFAEAAHGYFSDHWHELLDQPVELVAAQDWLPINAIGYDWETGCRIAEQLDARASAELIAQRNWTPDVPMGDEPAANTLPRIILRGFLAAHLTFGGQEHDLSLALGSRERVDAQLSSWRQRYSEIGQTYLQLEPA